MSKDTIGREGGKGKRNGDEEWKEKGEERTKKGREKRGGIGG